MLWGYINCTLIVYSYAHFILFCTNNNLNKTFTFFLVGLAGNNQNPNLFRMNLLKKIPFVFFSFLLLAGCTKKTEFDTTGKLVINFRDLPECYFLYTESSYGTGMVPLYEWSISGTYRPADIKVTRNGNSVTFEGLLYGNYILQACPYSNKLLVQVVAGGTKTYSF